VDGERAAVRVEQQLLRREPHERRQLAGPVARIDHPQHIRSWRRDIAVGGRGDGQGVAFLGEGAADITLVGIEPVGDRSAAHQRHPLDVAIDCHGELQAVVDRRRNVGQSGSRLADIGRRVDFDAVLRTDQTARRSRGPDAPVRQQQRGRVVAAADHGLLTAQVRPTLAPGEIARAPVDAGVVEFRHARGGVDVVVRVARPTAGQQHRASR
jgi:hypothetical protein